MKKLFLYLILILFCSLLNAQYVIKGKFYGQDSVSITNQKVFLISNVEHFPRPIVDSMKIINDNEFIYESKIPGLFRFRITADKYNEYEIPIYIETKDTVEFISILKPRNYGDKFELGNSTFLDGKNSKLKKAPDKTQKFMKVYLKYAEFYEKYHQHAINGRRNGISDNDYYNNYNWKNDKKELDELIKIEKDDFLKKAWSIM